MPRHIHLDLVGGIAGDMFVASMLDAFPEHYGVMCADLNACGVMQHVTVDFESAVNHGLQARRFVVLSKQSSGKRIAYYPGLHRMLEQSELDAAVKQCALRLLRTLAEAESRMHGVTLDKVHFHELADWDSIADIVAASSLIVRCAVDSWSCGAVPWGSGLVKTEHGMLPVPAPAALHLLRGFQVFDDGEVGERVTPTGAAILSDLIAPRRFDPQEQAGKSLDLSGKDEAVCTRKDKAGNQNTPAHPYSLVDQDIGDAYDGHLPDMDAVGRSSTGSRPSGRIERVGIGAGQRQLEGRPNILRCTVLSTNRRNIKDDKETDEPLKTSATTSTADQGMFRIDTPPRHIQVDQITDTEIAVKPQQESIVGADAQSSELQILTDEVLELTFDIDDMTPEELSVSLEYIRAEQGVRDVCSQVGYGKKGRALFSVTVLCELAVEESVCRACFTQTSTLGIRVQRMTRRVLARSEFAVNDNDGDENLSASVKIAKRPETISAKVSCDDLQKIGSLEQRRQAAARLMEQVKNKRS